MKVSGEYCIPQSEILRLRSRLRLHFQFAKPPKFELTTVFWGLGYIQLADPGDGPLEV